MSLNITPTEATLLAQDIQRVAANEAGKAVADQLGAHRGYTFPIYDPAMPTDIIPLLMYTYSIDLRCEPVDLVVTFGKDVLTGANYAPGGTASFDMMLSTNGGASWSVMSSTPTTVAAGAMRGVGARFTVKTLEVGHMIWMRMNSGGGGKGILGNFRVRRLGEHTRRERGR